MEIPILAYDIVNTPHMIFSMWMPLNENEFIVVQEEKATLKLWFDRSCWHNVTHAGGDIPNHVNVLVSKVFADVTLRHLPENMIEYIKLTAAEPQPPESLHQLEYRKLGQQVYQLTLTHLNRLISYTRSLKGQYWLREYPIDKEEGLYAVNLAFKARVLIDTEWFRWSSDIRQLVIGREGGCHDKDRFIKQDDWAEAKEFITSQHRTTLVWELLAGAEWLAGIGHRRSALTEAVTALEVAISEFASQPKSEEVFGILGERINVTSLKKWVEHMGLSGTIHYLFPVIFSEEKIPKEVLKRCQEAVQQRQNVIHSGQRDVQEDKLSEYLHAIRQICRLLEIYQM